MDDQGATKWMPASSGLGIDGAEGVLDSDLARVDYHHQCRENDQDAERRECQGKDPEQACHRASGRGRAGAGQHEEERDEQQQTAEDQLTHGWLWLGVRGV